MKTVSLLISVLLLVATPATWASAQEPTFSTNPATPVAAIKSNLPTSSSAQRIQSQDYVLISLSDEVAVEQLRGEQAMAHLYSLFSRQPGAFDAARASLEKRGFEPTDYVYVERTVRLASGGMAPGTVSTVPVQDYQESNSDGEIVFWSWDDGDDNTWEGVIYVEVYAADDASTWEGQIDASTEEHNWVYYEKTWDGRPGDEPWKAQFPVPPQPGDSLGIVHAINPIGELARHESHGWTYYYPADLISHGTPYVQVDWIDWARCWRRCVVLGCSGAAIGCIAAGAAWPGCFGATCFAAEVICAVDCFWDK